jgi:predicted DNA-binding transcriptional regulator YafY
MMIGRAFMVSAVSAVALMLSADSFAQQSQTGTAREAQAMLTKTVAAMKADKTNTIAMINKGRRRVPTRRYLSVHRHASSQSKLCYGG